MGIDWIICSLFAFSLLTEVKPVFLCGKSLTIFPLLTQASAATESITDHNHDVFSLNESESNLLNTLPWMRTSAGHATICVPQTSGKWQSETVIHDCLFPLTYSSNHSSPWCWKLIQLYCTLIYSCCLKQPPGFHNTPTQDHLIQTWFKGSDNV